MGERRRRRRTQSENKEVDYKKKHHDEWERKRRVGNLAEFHGAALS